MNTDIHDELFEATAKCRKQGYSTFCRKTDGGQKEAIRTMPYLLSMRRQIGRSLWRREVPEEIDILAGNIQLNNLLRQKHMRLGIRAVSTGELKILGNVLKLHNGTNFMCCSVLFLGHFQERCQLF